MTDNFINFMDYFKKNLEKTFDCSMDSWDYWVNLSGTGGWKEALKISSERHMPEVFVLWNMLDWWSSDLFDSWLIDCAEYLGLCKKEKVEENKPLTVEELEDMINNPVYIQDVDECWWDIVDNIIHNRYLITRSSVYLPLEDYGISWFAYRKQQNI